MTETDYITNPALSAAIAHWQSNADALRALKEMEDNALSAPEGQENLLYQEHGLWKVCENREKEPVKSTKG